MAADILEGGKDFAIEAGQRSDVDRARVAIQRLPDAKAFQRPRDGSAWHLRTVGQFGQSAVHRRDILQAAQPAAAFRHARALAFAHHIGAPRRHAKARDPAALDLGDIAAHIRRAIGQPFGQRKAGGKGGEVIITA